MKSTHSFSLIIAVALLSLGCSSVSDKRYLSPPRLNMTDKPTYQGEIVLSFAPCLQEQEFVMDCGTASFTMPIGSYAISSGRKVLPQVFPRLIETAALHRKNGLPRISLAVVAEDYSTITTWRCRVSIIATLFDSTGQAIETFTGQGEDHNHGVGYFGATKPVLRASVNRAYEALALNILSWGKFDQLAAPRDRQTHDGHFSQEVPTRNFPRRNIAVANLDALGLPVAEVLTLSESLRVNLLNTDYFTVVSRSDMARILEEQEWQRSSCSDTACLVEMGKLLSAEKIIGGTVGRVGDTFSVAVRMVDVESGRIDHSVMRNISGREDALLDAVAHLANELARQYAESRK